VCGALSSIIVLHSSSEDNVEARETRHELILVAWFVMGWLLAGVLLRFRTGDCLQTPIVFTMSLKKDAVCHVG
jgi:hypothetical protein